MTRAMKVSLGLLALIVACAASVNAETITTIYQDDFSGSSTAGLAGTTPDTTTGGATWISSSYISANGAINNTSTNTLTGNSNAYLAFTPVAGHIYTLSADLNISQYVSTDVKWLAFGFVYSSTTPSTSSSFFTSSTSYGAYALTSYSRSAATTVSAKMYRGKANTNQVGTTQTYTGVAATTYNTIKEVLDTTGAAWTIKWYCDGAEIGSSSYTATTNPTTINYVGFGTRCGATGGIDNFSLTSTTIPEPGTIALLAAGMLGLLAYAWRKRK